MVHLLAQSQPEPVFLMSLVKPILVFALLLGWAWLIERLDKDAQYFYLPREWLNLGHLAIGVLSFALILLIPFFAVGFVLALLLIAGNLVGYGFYRNSKLPKKDQWSFSLETFTQRMRNYQQAQAQRKASMKLLNSEESPLPVPQPEDETAEAHNTLEDMAEFAFQRQAETMEIAVDNQKAGLFVKVDGVRYPQPEVEPQLALQMVDYIKHAAGMDVSDRRKRQQGTMYMEGQQLGRHELQLETSGSTRGLTLTAMIDASEKAALTLDQLGLLENQHQQVTQVLEAGTQGIVIVAGPRQTGITTTLYSLLQWHDPYTASVVTLEDEKLTDCEGVHHTEIGEGVAPQQFNNKLGNILRGDPNVVMLSHLADEQTAKLCQQSAEEVRVYFPLAERDTFTALQSWVKLIGDRKKAAECLSLITAQRLLRKLCTTCRAPYKPDANALKKMNLPADKVGQLYRASGQVQVKDRTETCPACHGMAYRGRVAVFEVMPLDDTARKHIADGNTDQLRSHLRKQKMLWMQEAALHKVVQGVTDIKEVTRVLGGGSGGKNGGGQQKQQAQQQPAQQ